MKAAPAVGVPGEGPLGAGTVEVAVGMAEPLADSREVVAMALVDGVVDAMVAAASVGVVKVEVERVAVKVEVERVEVVRAGVEMGAVVWVAAARGAVAMAAWAVADRAVVVTVMVAMAVAGKAASEAGQGGPGMGTAVVVLGEEGRGGAVANSWGRTAPSEGSGQMPMAGVATGVKVEMVEREIMVRVAVEEMVVGIRVMVVALVEEMAVVEEAAVMMAVAAEVVEALAVVGLVVVNLAVGTVVASKAVVVMAGAVTGLRSSESVLSERPRSPQPPRAVS